MLWGWGRGVNVRAEDCYRDSRRVTIGCMATPSLADLLKLPPRIRVELALALWESLPEIEREAGFELTDTEAAELDRRWEEHLANPDAATPWETVRDELRGRT